MRNLSDIKDEEALLVFGDLIDPACEIMLDAEIKAAAEANKVLEVTKLIFKNHSKSMMQILATLDGVPVSDYHCDLKTVPLLLAQILADKEIVSFFASLASQGPVNAIGSATANTEADAT